MSFSFKQAKNSTSDKSGEKTYELLPDGDYMLEADEVTPYKAKTGTPMLKVRFTIIDGKYKNRKVWHQFPLTAKAMVFVFNYLKKIGSDLVEKDEVETNELIGAITGSKIVGEITREQLQNGPINVVDKFKKFDKQSPEPQLNTNPPADNDDIFA